MIELLLRIIGMYLSTTYQDREYRNILENVPTFLKRTNICDLGYKTSTCKR